MDKSLEALDPDGLTIGEYECATFYQDGQTSTIYKARASSTVPEQAFASGVVALKYTVLTAQGPPHNSAREARLLEEAEHDHVIPLLDSFYAEPGHLVLVFPFMHLNLQTLLRQESLSADESEEIIRALFAALAHVHALGVIHRDVKPSNILMQSQMGPAYLADFGIAWSPRDKDSEASAKKITDVGTASYRPPELLFGHAAYDASLDIWAAGCVVAEMMRADHQQLFDAGPLGSELGLIKSMFSTLGTPTDETWPSARQYPDWGKMRFQQYPATPWSQILGSTSEPVIDFVKNSVVYESTRRMTAAEALDHPLLQKVEKQQHHRLRRAGLDTISEPC